MRSEVSDRSPSRVVRISGVGEEGISGVMGGEIGARTTGSR